MIWIDNINQLWVHRKGVNDPCYCEYLVYPSDILLQGILDTNTSNGFNYKVYIYNTDGVELEDATSYFSFYSAINPNGKKYFNLTCNAFSPAMCLNKCYILRVVVTDYDDIVWFDRLTEQYCQTDCCDIPREIGIGGDSGNCPVYLCYVQKIYLYDSVSDTLTLLATGGLEYTDLAVIGSNLYARDQYGGIDVYIINGNTLSFSHKITGLPVGQSLGSDATHLYIDDGTTIKKFMPSNALGTLVTVVSSLPVTQGDIYVYQDGTIMCSVDDTVTKLQFWLNNSLVNSLPIVDSGSTPIDNIYGLFFVDNVLHAMTDYGFIYTINLSTGVGTLASSAPNTLVNNSRWNGAGQSVLCGEVETNTPDVDVIPVSNCQQYPLVQIKSRFECVDSETGYYYGLSDKVLSGTPSFTYEKVLNLPASIKREPRDIHRFISFNCKLQRSESFRPYTLKGQGVDALLPDWKLDELENMLHGNYIEVNDFGVSFGKKEYQFEGGSIGERVHNCINLFRVTIPLRGCMTRNDFGCGVCDSNVENKTFVIPRGTQGENFYTENKYRIGGFQDVIGYYNALGFDASDVSANYPNSYGAISVSGSGIIPPFYADYTYQRNMIFGSDTPPTDNTIPCAAITFDYIYGANEVCIGLNIDYVYSKNVVPMTVGIIGVGDWITSGTSIISLTSGKMSLTARNPTILPESYTGVLGGKSYTGNGTDTQVFAELDGKTLLTVSIGGQSYNEDYFTQTGTSVELTAMTFDDTVVLVWAEGVGGTPIDALSALSGKSFTGNSTNTQVFAELNQKEVLSISMGGQDYTSDTFTQTGNSISWNDPMMQFVGTVALMWISNDGNALTKVRLANEAIGIMELGGRPATDKIIQVGTDKYIAIGANGIITYTGEPDTVDIDGAHISLTNIVYELN